jgi:hypothetical protein
MNTVICIIIIIIVLYLIMTHFYVRYINNTKYIHNLKDNTIKILHLVLYNEGTSYENKMKHITETYYAQFSIVDTYYYTFSELYDKITIVNNICYIPGKETYLPGILDKTIKTLFYFMENTTKYDYVIRSNVSTIINFELLIPTMHEYDYGGPKYSLVTFFDPICGISNFTYFFTHYVFGTSIILSKSLVNKMIQYKKLIRYDVIDDVSIGYLIKHIPHVKIKSYIHDTWYNGDILPTYIFYRNKSSNREDDVFNMKYIIRLISKNHTGTYNK